jgi:hypothetical protein
MKKKRYVMTMLADNGQKVVFAVSARDETEAVDRAYELYPDHVLCHYMESRA